MNFWEDFFALDKIYIPGIAAFLVGFLLIILCSLLNYNPTNFEIMSLMGIGFFIGNIIKTNKLQEQRQLELKLKKRKKYKNK